MSEPRFVTFSSAQDPRSWNPDATFDGDVITCLTDGDAKKAERLYNSLQAEIERLKEFEWKYKDLCK